jgi:outer membrane protein assembly factor BamB
VTADAGRQEWVFQTGGVVATTPLVYGKSVLIGSRDRHFYSLDCRTGELLGKQALAGPITESAVVADGKIVVTCRRNRLYLFEGEI